MGGQKIAKSTGSRVCAYFNQLVKSSDLYDFLNRSGVEIGIVGGAVRDILISENFKDKPFSDVDIALTSEDSLEILISHFKNAFEITENYFGGIKIKNTNLGEIDFWVWPKEKNKADREFWLTKLSSIDFGINALVYTWPNNELVLREEFVKDKNSRVINKLAPTQEHQYLNPLRAVALICSIENKFSIKFQLGPQLKNDLIELLTDIHNPNLIKVQDYLFKKVKSGRWPLELIEYISELYTLLTNDFSTITHNQSELNILNTDVITALQHRKGQM